MGHAAPWNASRKLTPTWKKIPRITPSSGTPTAQSPTTMPTGKSKPSNSANQKAGRCCPEASCSSSSDTGKRKRSKETCQKISEALARKWRERKLGQEPLLVRHCGCGCGEKLSENAAKKTKYIRDHGYQNKPRPQIAESARSRLKQRWKDGLIQWKDETIKKRAKSLSKPRMSELTKKGPKHHRAFHGIFRSPDNKTYSVHNITAFVRKHEHLFIPEDLKWDTRGQCNAAGGLSKLTPRRNHPQTHWKGWTLVSFTETFYNRGESLLSGESSSQTNDPAMASADEKTPTKETTL